MEGVKLKWLVSGPLGPRLIGLLAQYKDYVRSFRAALAVSSQGFSEYEALSSVPKQVIIRRTWCQNFHSKPFSKDDDANLID